MRGFAITVLVIAVVVVGIVLITRSNDNAATTPSPTASDLLTSSPTPSSSASGTSAMFDLQNQNNSNEDGSVSLTEVSGKTTVLVTVANEPSGASQPAHIHLGSCPNPGAVLYSLNSVVNGKSTTTLNIPLATLKTKGALAVNVHKSAADINTYVSCGNLSF